MDAGLQGSKGVFGVQLGIKCMLASNLPQRRVREFIYATFALLFCSCHYSHASYSRNAGEQQTFPFNIQMVGREMGSEPVSIVFVGGPHDAEK